jgi:hypothetical protein
MITDGGVDGAEGHTIEFVETELGGRDRERRTGARGQLKLA